MAQRWLKFDVWEVLLILVFAMGAAYLVRFNPYAFPDNRAAYVVLEQRYGPRVSQYGEEWLIRDFFKDRRNGVFVDVGAADHKEYSTTYTLEKALGWSGIAVEPQPQYAEGYMKRPRTRLVQAFVSDKAGETVTLYVPPYAPALASFDPKYLESLGYTGRPMAVPTVTLTKLLEEARISKIDFLSMDIEHAEPLALAGLDIKRFQPELVCIEAHDEIRQQLINYFHDNGYVVVGKYLPLDWLNMYFTPRKPANSTSAPITR